MPSVVMLMRVISSCDQEAFCGALWGSRRPDAQLQTPPAHPALGFRAFRALALVQSPARAPAPGSASVSRACEGPSLPLPLLHVENVGLTSTLGRILPPRHVSAITPRERSGQRVEAPRTDVCAQLPG